MKRVQLVLLGALAFAVACNNGEDDDGETGDPIADMDSDGVADEDDNCPEVANADQENGDADTLGDACDNCPATDNEGQENGDADTLDLVDRRLHSMQVSFELRKAQDADSEHAVRTLLRQVPLDKASFHRLRTAFDAFESARCNQRETQVHKKWKPADEWNT